MKRFQIIKTLTVVVFLLSGVSIQAQMSAKEKADKRKKIEQDYKDCMKKVNEIPADNQPVPGSNGLMIVVDRNSEKRSNEKEICNSAKSSGLKELEEDSDFKDSKSSCNSLHSEYLKDQKEAASKCAEAGAKDVKSCREAAALCGAAVSTEGDDAEKVVKSVQGLVGIYAEYQRTVNGGGGAAAAGSIPSGCLLEDREAYENERQKYEDQVTRLREQNEDEVSKQADLDQEIADKEKDTKEKIREAEEEVNKKQIEIQTKQQEEASKIQKMILQAQKRQYDNAVQINKLNMDLSNLQFLIQQTTIEMSDAKLSDTCMARVEAKKAQLTAAPPAAAGAKATANRVFTAKESMAIKKALKLEESTCLQSEVLKRSAQLKGIVDKRASLQAQIDTLNRSTQDEEKSIEIEKQSLERTKETMSKEQQNAIDSKNQKLSALGEALTRQKAANQKKKESMDAKIKARKDQIEVLLAKRNNVKMKYKPAMASITEIGTSRKAFIGQCCNPKEKELYKKFKSQCGAAGDDRSEDDDAKSGKPSTSK